MVTVQPIVADFSQLEDALFAPDYKVGTQFVFKGLAWTRKKFGPGLRGADSDDGRWRVVEQNQSKSSFWALVARQGHRVIWVFDRKAPRFRQYYGLVVNGKAVRLSQVRADDPRILEMLGLKLAMSTVSSSVPGIRGHWRPIEDTRLGGDGQSSRGSNQGLGMRPNGPVLTGAQERAWPPRETGRGNDRPDAHRPGCPTADQELFPLTP